MSQNGQAWVIWSTGCCYTRSTPERKDPTTCGTEAPLPSRFPHNIPDETVKALAFCLAITTFSTVTTGASWSRPPSSWTGVRAARRCVVFDSVGFFSDPLSTNNMKGAPCSLVSWHSTSPSSSNTFLAPEGTACVLCHSGVALCSSGLGHGLRYYHVPEKDASEKCLDAVLGKVQLPCWRFIDVRNGPGVVFWHSISLSVSVAWLLSFYIVFFWRYAGRFFVIAGGSVKHDSSY